MTILYEWRGDFDKGAVNALHAEGFDQPALDVDWRTRAHRHSLGWVCARDGSDLVAQAARGDREAGCEWLHVDFEDDLRAFYFDACGFAPTTAGLIAL